MHKDWTVFTFSTRSKQVTVFTVEEDSVRKMTTTRALSTKQPEHPGLTEGKPPTLSVHGAMTQRDSSHPPLWREAQLLRKKSVGWGVQNYKIEWSLVPRIGMRYPSGQHAEQNRLGAIFLPQGRSSARKRCHLLHRTPNYLKHGLAQPSLTSNQSYVSCSLQRTLTFASNARNYADMQCPVPLKAKRPAGKPQPAS